MAWSTVSSEESLLAAAETATQGYLGTTCCPDQVLHLSTYYHKGLATCPHLCFGAGA